jgi:hypothetical protein
MPGNNDDVVGHKIRSVRQMHKHEWEAEGWHRGAIVLELSNGTKLYASKDDEGNGPGAMFGIDSRGDSFAL